MSEPLNLQAGPNLKHGANDRQLVVTINQKEPAGIDRGQ